MAERCALDVSQRAMFEQFFHVLVAKHQFKVNYFAHLILHNLPAEIHYWYALHQIAELLRHVQVTNLQFLDFD